MIATDYRKELDKVVTLGKLAMAANIDIDRLRDELEKLETLGPMFAPSEWMRGGAENLDQQRTLIEGVAPFLRALDSLRQKSNDRLQRMVDTAVREAEESAGLDADDENEGARTVRKPRRQADNHLNRNG